MGKQAFDGQGDRFNQMDVCKLYSPELPLKFWNGLKSTNKNLLDPHHRHNGAFRHKIYTPGDFLLAEELLKPKSCKPPKAWSGLKSDRNYIVFEGKDLDGDKIKDFAWCTADPARRNRCCLKLADDPKSQTRCKNAKLGTVMSTQGCDEEVNSPWIVLNAPNVFAPNNCVCTCDIPRCYGGSFNAKLQAVRASSNLWTKQQSCLRSESGRKQLERCCEAKIERFKRAVASCKGMAADVREWCKGVPDGNEVQVGGRPRGTSGKYYAHTPTDACASSKWKEIDVPTVLASGNSVHRGIVDQELAGQVSGKDDKEPDLAALLQEKAESTMQGWCAR